MVAGGHITNGIVQQFYSAFGLVTKNNFLVVGLVSEAATFQLGIDPN